MDLTASVLLGIILVVALLRTESFALSIKGNSLTKPDLVNQAEGRNQLAAESSQWDNNGHTRVDRSVKDDMEKGLKEFSDRMAKLPDQMGGAVKKFFEERGISWDGIQKILGEIWKNVEQLIEMVKKAM